MSNDHFESDENKQSYSAFENEQPEVTVNPDQEQFLPGMELCRKYRLEYEAGNNETGIVWKSFDLSLNQYVALKFLPPEIRRQEKISEQICRATQAARLLNHQYVRPIYGWENDPTFGSIIVMKWLDGVTLAELLKEKLKFRSPFETAQILEIIQKTAEALDYAHKHRATHSDVKPSNIIIKFTGGKIEEFSLINFALSAEIRESMIRVSAASILVGESIAYLSPEQWRGQKADAKSDQYSLAVLAYELFNGRPPFMAANPELLRLCVLQDIPEPIKNIPESINDALQKALSKDPKERFNSCSEFAAALSTPQKQAPLSPSESEPINQSTLFNFTAPSTEKNTANGEKPSVFSTENLFKFGSGIKSNDKKEKQISAESNPFAEHSDSSVSPKTSDPFNLNRASALTENGNSFPTFLSPQATSQNENSFVTPFQFPDSNQNRQSSGLNVSAPFPPVTPNPFTAAKASQPSNAENSDNFIPTPPAVSWFSGNQESPASASSSVPPFSDKSKKKTKSQSSHSSKSSVLPIPLPKILILSGIILLAAGAFWFVPKISDMKDKTDSMQTTLSNSESVPVSNTVSPLDSSSENFDAPDFHTIRRCLEQKRFSQVREELQKISQMRLSPADSQRATRLEILTNYSENFLKDVERTLERLSPPVELCGGEAGLVESGNRRAVIHFAGENILFTMDAPKQKGKDLFDIFYRHRYADSVEKGNLKPTIEYAAFLLLTSPEDRAKAEGLLKKALEKGNPKDKTAAREIMTELNIAF